MACCLMNLAGVRIQMPGNSLPRCGPCPRSCNGRRAESAHALRSTTRDLVEEFYLDELCTHVPPSNNRVPAAADGPPEVDSWFNRATTRASA